MSDTFYSDTIDRLTASGNLRKIPADSNASLIDLSSNDYLGLGADRKLREEFLSQTDVAAIPFSSVASRLLAGRQKEHHSLEDLLSQLYCRPVLTANSGYHANVGQVSALCSAPSTLVVADKLVHASIIDGIRLSGAPFERFRHNDLNHLDRILHKEAHKFDRVWVITESVFSMDGDKAPISDIVALKRKHGNIRLYIDEAHAFGVEGDRGLGICRSLPEYEEIDVVIGTLGKAAASMGAFAAVSRPVREYLVNRSRAHIFSTALPPFQAAWSEFVIRKIIPMDSEREHLRRLGERLATYLSEIQGASNTVPPSHIQPFVVGDPYRAVALSDVLVTKGFKVLPIRVPTVPPGTDRLRISLNASLTERDIDSFGEALKSVMQ
ncbi:MAG: 8-amino-7-oxononanoate synthase [Duncaniella sp.]|nr:8-amino-7-oxononanoate synthase [Duncaniella sp.]